MCLAPTTIGSDRIDEDGHPEEHNSRDQVEHPLRVSTDKYHGDDNRRKSVMVRIQSFYSHMFLHCLTLLNQSTLPSISTPLSLRSLSFNVFLST